MRYFTLPELCATSCDIDNVPDWEHVENLRKLVTEVLIPVRELAKRAIHVKSAYRCPAVNKEVGGVENSQHLRGQAADISVGSIEDNKLLFDQIIKSGLTLDQLILERGGVWIHISIAPRPRQQILRLP
jgi:hypothetical protein